MPFHLDKPSTTECEPLNMEQPAADEGKTTFFFSVCLKYDMHEGSWANGEGLSSLCVEKLKIIPGSWKTSK